MRTADVFGGGLLGIAVHPAFENNHFIYVYYTYEKDGALWNKILRITESNNKLDAAKTIFDKIQDLHIITEELSNLVQMGNSM